MYSGSRDSLFTSTITLLQLPPLQDYLTCSSWIGFSWWLFESGWSGLVVWDVDVWFRFSLGPVGVGFGWVVLGWVWCGRGSRCSGYMCQKTSDHACHLLSLGFSPGLLHSHRWRYSSSLLLIFNKRRCRGRPAPHHFHTIVRITQAVPGLRWFGEVKLLHNVSNFGRSMPRKDL